MAAFAAQPGAGVACGKLQYWRDTERDAVFPSRPDQLGIEMAINHPTVFVRREVYAELGLFRLDYRYAMDYEIALRWKRYNVRFASIDAILAHMRLDGAGDRNWRKGLREMRQAQVELFGWDPVWFLKFRFKLLKAYAGRMLDAAGLSALTRWYRSRLSGFRREYGEGKP